MISHSNNLKKIDFSACGCFVLMNGELLIIERQSGKPYPRHWAVPTGKIESDELPIDCIKRELEEEIGIKTSEGNLNFISKNIVEVDGISFLFYSYALIISKLPDIELKDDEVRAVQWVPMTAIRKRRVVPYFFNTLNDTLEWYFTNALQLRLLPEAETTHVKCPQVRTKSTTRIRKHSAN